VAYTVITALGKLRQEDQEFKASLSYIVGSRTAWAIYSKTLSQKTNKQGLGAWLKRQSTTHKHKALYSNPRTTNKTKQNKKSRLMSQSSPAA
jgi:hypothetical protein